MALTRTLMLDRARARDASYDGRFITGVMSTGIYCLPSCSARTPNEKNIRFFPGPAEARDAGLRACLRCRPDDFHAGRDPELERARAAAEAALAEPARVNGVPALAALAGAGTTRLHEIFRAHWQCTPAVFLQHARVMAARRLLLGDEGVLEAGLAVGYQSASAFHQTFRRLTAMTPAAWRRLTDRTSFTLNLPTGYPADAVLAYVGRDPASATERVAGRRLERAVLYAGRPLRLVVHLTDHEAQVAVDAGGAHPGAAAMAHAAEAVHRLLGLGGDVAALDRRLATRLLGATMNDGHRALPVPLAADPFEALVWAVLGQHVSVGFACTLRRDLVALAGTPVPAGMLAHPDAERLAALTPTELTSLRLSRRKAEVLLAVARRVANGDLVLGRFPESPATVLERALLAEAGIGPWTAGYVLMRGGGFPDCVPVGDSALATALERLHDLPGRPGPDQVRALMAPYAPHRSLATFRLWSMLGVRG